MPTRLEKFRDKNIKEIFTIIYNEKEWQSEGFEETVSGSGSTLSHTRNIRKMLPKFLKKENINSIIDLGCGDLNWISTIMENFDKYLGIDVVDDLITNNISKYSNDKIKFEISDIVEYEIESGYDAILVKDVFVHLKNDQINFILDKIKNSDIKYIIATNFEELLKNYDNEIEGMWRPTNLCIEPFNLGDPLYSINEFSETYEWRNEIKDDKTLTIWKIK